MASVPGTETGGSGEPANPVENNGANQQAHRIDLDESTKQVLSQIVSELGKVQQRMTTLHEAFSQHVHETVREEPHTPPAPTPEPAAPEPAAAPAPAQAPAAPPEVKQQFKKPGPFRNARRNKGAA